jgi:hypothetical protein
VDGFHVNGESGEEGALRSVLNRAKENGGNRARVRHMLRREERGAGRSARGSRHRLASSGGPRLVAVSPAVWVERRRVGPVGSEEEARGLRWKTWAGSGGKKTGRTQGEQYPFLFIQNISKILELIRSKGVLPELEKIR